MTLHYPKIDCVLLLIVCPKGKCIVYITIADNRLPFTAYSLPKIFSFYLDKTDYTDNFILKAKAKTFSKFQ